MEISKIKNDNSRIAFRRGLTPFETGKVKDMHCFAYVDIANNLKNSYGLDANFAGCNTVAWCVNEVVKIMQKAGFKLPSKFSFEDYGNPNVLGTYSPDLDTVYINSEHIAFTDLEKQNKLEESQGSFHPNTKHFLNSYLHEFSHAAHFKNLTAKYGKTEGYNIMQVFLRNYAASTIIREPMIATLKCIFPTLNLLGIIDEVIPPANGEYAAENLNEYFAEKNARKLALQLGDNYMPSNVQASLSNYSAHPKGWDFKQELLNVFMKPKHFLIGALFPIISRTAGIIEKCQEELDFIDGDIFNGNVDYLKKIC